MAEVDATTYQSIGSKKMDKHKAFKDKFKKKAKIVDQVKEDSSKDAIKDRMNREKC